MIAPDTDRSNRPFAESHPIRLDLCDGGPPLRFKDLRCAARTELERKMPLWDDLTKRGYSLADCREIVNGRWPEAINRHPDILEDDGDA